MGIIYLFMLPICTLAHGKEQSRQAAPTYMFTLSRYDMPKKLDI